jgi:hypothetical protein
LRGRAMSRRQRLGHRRLMHTMLARNVCQLLGHDCLLAMRGGLLRGEYRYGLLLTGLPDRHIQPCWRFEHRLVLALPCRLIWHRIKHHWSGTVHSLCSRHICEHPWQLVVRSLPCWHSLLFTWRCSLRHLRNSLCFRAKCWRHDMPRLPRLTRFGLHLRQLLQPWLQNQSALGRPSRRYRASLRRQLFNGCHLQPGHGDRRDNRWQAGDAIGRQPHLELAASCHKQRA